MEQKKHCERVCHKQLMREPHIGKPATPPSTTRCTHQQQIQIRLEQTQYSPGLTHKVHQTQGQDPVPVVYCFYSWVVDNVNPSPARQFHAPVLDPKQPVFNSLSIGLRQLVCFDNGGYLRMLQALESKGDQT